jgi:hypothetical protein
MVRSLRCPHSCERPRTWMIRSLRAHTPAKGRAIDVEHTQRGTVVVSSSCNLQPMALTLHFAHNFVSYSTSARRTSAAILPREHFDVLALVQVRGSRGNRESREAGAIVRRGQTSAGAGNRQRWQSSASILGQSSASRGNRQQVGAIVSRCGQSSAAGGREVATNHTKATKRKVER